MATNMPFKPRAQLLLQLGEQLIRNESVAVLELLKNSYDADATKVSISMNDIDNPDIGEITILDNGIGMDIDIIKNIWMEPGNNHKRKKIQENKRSKLGRLPIGEKGIGRFGVHKLGREIELVSKQEGKKEVYLYIDWTQFETAEYLEDVKITIHEREPEVFTEDKTGTKIVINKLSTKWTRGMLRNVYRAITSLNSPFVASNTFKVKFKTSKQDWLDNLLTFDDIKEFALYHVTITLSGNEMEFTYEFLPYDTMQNLSSRKIREEHIRMIHDDEGYIKDINLNKYKIGDIVIEMFIYDRKTSIISKNIFDKKSFTKYLDENGGISVYRDKMRVYNYGERDNDWLGLDLKRVNRPTKLLSNNIVLGAVFINRNDSTDLKEKSNREGFIENDAYHEFHKAISFAIDRISAHRNADKERIRKSETGAHKPVIDDISSIRKKLHQCIPNEKNRKEIDNYLKQIEKDFEHLKTVYLKTANAGMSYGVVIHEIEKVIKELNNVVKAERASLKVRYLAERLSRLVQSYADLLRNKTKENVEIKEIIEQALFDVEYRLNYHNIDIIDKYSKNNDNINVVCTWNLVVGSLINIIDNSIYWTEYAKISNKKILIKVTREIEDYVSIVVADNGCGFSLAPEDMIIPFVGTKPSGMGVGLHIVNEIMISQGGMLEFPRYGDVKLPEEFKGGAVIALCFKEKTNDKT